MSKRIIFIFLLVVSLGFFKLALAQTSVPFCLNQVNQGLICRPDVSPNVGRPMNIKEKEGFTFYITPGQLGLSAEQYRFLVLRLKVKTDFPRWQINFASRQAGVLSLQGFIFKNNRRFTDYYFDLSYFNDWSGTIDRLYFQFNPQQIELNSLALLRPTSGLIIKSLWQEFWSQPAENLSWINGLPVIFLNGIPIIRYIFILALIVVMVLAVAKQRDPTISKNWSRTVLIILLAGWFLLEGRVLYANWWQLKNDWELKNTPSAQRQEELVGQLLQNPVAVKDLYHYINFVEQNLPLGAKIFIPNDSSYLSVLLVYNFIDHYSVVKDINQADYVLLYHQSLPDAAKNWPIKFVAGTNQLIFQRP